jgi:uncharacterized protein YdiU (UPF0061 family)
MLREYLIAEAMHALGIPAARALAVVATGEDVIRETVLPGAVLCRVAASHLRVGTFQSAARKGDPLLVQRLADYAIARHYLSAVEAENPYLAFFEDVVDAQASLVARWMLVGFVHGVMNTDNMTSPVKRSTTARAHSWMSLIPRRCSVRSIRPAVTRTAISRPSRSGTWRA